MEKVKDGLYLFYVKDGKSYSTIMTDEQWNLLQLMSRVIYDGKPIEVFDGPTINVETLESWRNRS